MVYDAVGSPQWMRKPLYAVKNILKSRRHIPRNIRLKLLEVPNLGIDLGANRLLRVLLNVNLLELGETCEIEEGVGGGGGGGGVGVVHKLAHRITCILFGHIL